MSTFKEQLKADLDTFINMDEFADEHELNGETVNCVVQSPTEQEMFQQGIDYSGYEAARGRLVIVHIKREALEDVPAEGQEMTLDGEYGDVDRCVEDLGMLSIYLHFNHA